MLKYAVRHNGADWKKINVIDDGTPEKMEAAFGAGTADYVHLQGPVACVEMVVSVGASMPAVAFSSLCCDREFQKGRCLPNFPKAYERASGWVRTVPAEGVAAAEAPFFPLIASEVLTLAIRSYQALGCWDGGIEVPRELYEQALNVFQSNGEIKWRHRFGGSELRYEPVPAAM